MSFFVNLNYIATATCVRIRRAVALLTISLGALGISSQMVIAQPQVTGQWVTLPYTMPVNPIHLTLMHTGQVLIVAGSENNPLNHPKGQPVKSSKAAVWDLGGVDINTGKIRRTPDLNWDVFCNGSASFPDGRCFIIGGTKQYDPFHGEARTTVFDPLAHQFDPTAHRFCEMQNMAHGRWYATGIVLPDGRIWLEQPVPSSAFFPRPLPVAACPAGRSCLLFGSFITFEDVRPGKSLHALAEYCHTL
jgi:hypothetical protein